MADMDDKERSRDSGRDRDRSRRGDRPSRFSESSIRDRSSDRGTRNKSSSSSNCRVYVSNISYEYRWQEIKDLFREHVGDVSFVELFVDENDKPKGCGIVEFSDASLVKKCMEVMHRFDLKGRKLVIKEDFGNERDKYGNIINGRRGRGGGADRDRHMDKGGGGDWDDIRDSHHGHGGGGRRGGMDHHNQPPSLLSNMMGRGGNIGGSGGGHSEPAEFKWGNTYGLSPQFLESLNIHKPLVNRVFVANLDYKVDEKKLREVFKLCGKVQDVELYHDKDGNSRGFAVVEYDHPVESVQAISMLHNQLLYDRAMTVRMDRVDHDIPLKLPEGLKGIGMGLGMNGEPLRDVSRNLPSTNNVQNNQASAMGGNSNQNNSGQGILGAVPTPAGLQALGNLGNTAAALSSVVNNQTLAGLTGQSAAALQASLAGVQTPFLAQQLGANLGNLNANELNLANLAAGSNLGSSLSGLSNHHLVALGNSGSGGASDNTAQMVNTSSMMNSRLLANNDRNDYSRGTVGGSSNSVSGYMQHGGGGNSGDGGGGNSGMHMGGGNDNGNNNTGMGQREYTSSSTNRDYESPSSMRNNYDMHDNYRQTSALYSTVNNGSQNRSSSNLSSQQKRYSDMIVVKNLPISATWKMLKEKFGNVGDVIFVEMKGKDTAIIKYASDWQAVDAIKQMDGIRIDGRTLEVRFCY